MAGSKSAYLEAQLLNAPLGGATYTPPATWYVALSTAAFDPNATGSALSEVAATDYARIAVTNNTTNFPAATDSNPASKSIAIDVSFPTTTTDWGTVQSAYLVDALTAGNIGYGADALVPLPLPIGSTLVIQSGTWVFQET